MNTKQNGYAPLFRTSPFLDLIGPILQQKTEAGLLIALKAEDKHCNARGIVHGGVISILADVALGYNAAFSGQNPIPMVTANLTVDYAGSAKSGDWIEIISDVQKVGKSMAFANCYFSVNSTRIARASAVFSVIK